jgi:hypothetical protein
MFGTNDTNQTDNNQPAAAGGQAPLPPSPFMDGPADLPAAAPAPIVAEAPTPEPSGAPMPAPAPAQNEDALVSIKEQALSNLAPLVNHLEQTPEEKFKTTMMLIQASDDSSLVKEAYEAANQIADEKIRAQALLLVVNEINYFTQKGK